jgi:hypothetical protein
MIPVARLLKPCDHVDELGSSLQRMQCAQEPVFMDGDQHYVRRTRSLYVPAAGVTLPAVGFTNFTARVSAAETRRPAMPTPATSEGGVRLIGKSVVFRPVTVTVCSVAVTVAAADGVHEKLYSRNCLIVLPLSSLPAMVISPTTVVHELPCCGPQ